MAQFKEGDRVRVVRRSVTDEDRKSGLYFDHMAGIEGTIQNIYANAQIAVKAEISSLSKVTQEVHKESTKRMREKFLAGVSDEQRKYLTAEELNFDAHYMMLVLGSDLEKI
ncbi:MAG TPA: hypothetical protein PLX06_03770 [Fimbriimonadaceae bacterium]|nr:hypothetical protein [Fimbriimonadaceae bacterium]